MLKKKEGQAIPPQVVIEFLHKILPLNRLDEKALSLLARECIIDFFPKGMKIFRQQRTKVEHLYLIQKGGVKCYLQDIMGETTLKDYRGEGESFGALSIIEGTRANLTVETIEDTFCFLIKKEVVLAMLDKNKEISQYFLRSMSGKLVKRVYAELREQKVAPRAESALHLFSAQVGEISKGNLYKVPQNTTVQQAAVLMSDNLIGSLLVTDENNRIIGIVTDRDIRSKVVAKGLGYQTKISRIMASPVQTISTQAVCFDALLKMIKNKIHHLAVEQNNEIVNMITTHDIMVTQGTSPLYLFREILSQRSISGLYDISRKIPQVIRSLIEDGAKANNVTRMITVLNDHILDKLLSLLIDQFGPPPLSFTWLLLGSEGRREQTFKTDQDNAILYADPEDDRQGQAAAEYFTIFSEEAIKHLVKCGYPLCPGNNMASNLHWRQPLSVWTKYFQNWCWTPKPENVLNSTIFFDFRSGFGLGGLADQLHDRLWDTTQRAEIFLTHLAHGCLSSRPPLSFFKNFIVEKNGEHKNTFDLKTKAMVFFVDFARLMSLKHSINESNTLARLKLLQEEEHIPATLCTEIIEAYEFLMHLRLVHQLQMLEQNHDPNNYINPENLSDLERKTLKESFGVIRRFQNFIRQDFQIHDL